MTYGIARAIVKKYAEAHPRGWAYAEKIFPPEIHPTEFFTRLLQQQQWARWDNAKRVINRCEWELEHGWSEAEVAHEHDLVLYRC